MSAAVGVKLLLRGEAAMKAAAQILKTSRPCNVLGYGLMTPGTIWMGGKMLISAETMIITATVHDRMYEYGVDAWIKESGLQGYQKAAKGAEYWCTVAEVEMGILCELICPLYLTAGITAAKAGVFVHTNFKEVKEAYDIAPQAISLLIYFQRKYPVLCLVLEAGGLGSVLKGLKDEVITKENVASFIADLIKDVAKNPEEAIAHAAKVLAKVAWSTMRSKKTIGAALAHSALATGNRAGDELVGYMKCNGYQVTLVQAQAISKEIGRDPAAAMKLEELSRILEKLLPLLSKLQDEKESAAEE